ncbi:MAG: leucine-rich repeat domain-containing protein [Prevotella sp.]|nr:leucine-rich repeat domain-containing protein [Prevotella sp.]
MNSITIPNSVTTIERSAFFGCKRLTSINIPNSVTSIGDGAFRGCPINRVYLNKETEFENNSFLNSLIRDKKEWESSVHN